MIYFTSKKMMSLWCHATDVYGTTEMKLNTHIITQNLVTRLALDNSLPTELQNNLKSTQNNSSLLANY